MKKRGIFWLVAPAASAIAGFIIWIGFSFVLSGGSVFQTIVNLIAFILMGFGVLAFIPGLIYGIVLVSKK